MVSGFVTLIVFILALGGMIFVHELGHFIAARAVMPVPSDTKKMVRWCMEIGPYNGCNGVPFSRIRRRTPTP